MSSQSFYLIFRVGTGEPLFSTVPLANSIGEKIRKKAEQADARAAIDQSKGEAQRVGGAAGQTGGPANPVR